MQNRCRVFEIQSKMIPSMQGNARDLSLHRSFQSSIPQRLSNSNLRSHFLMSLLTQLLEVIVSSKGWGWHTTNVILITENSDGDHPDRKRVSYIANKNKLGPLKKLLSKNHIINCWIAVLCCKVEYVQAFVLRFRPWSWKDSDLRLESHFFKIFQG